MSDHVDTACTSSASEAAMIAGYSNHQQSLLPSLWNADSKIQVHSADFVSQHFPEMDPKHERSGDVSGSNSFLLSKGLDRDEIAKAEQELRDEKLKLSLHDQIEELSASCISRKQRNDIMQWQTLKAVRVCSNEDDHKSTKDEWLIAVKSSIKSIEALKELLSADLKTDHIKSDGRMNRKRCDEKSSLPQSGEASEDSNEWTQQLHRQNDYDKRGRMMQSPKTKILLQLQQQLRSLAVVIQSNNNATLKLMEKITRRIEIPEIENETRDGGEEKNDNHKEVLYCAQSKAFDVIVEFEMQTKNYLATISTLEENIALLEEICEELRKDTVAKNDRYLMRGNDMTNDESVTRNNVPNTPANAYGEKAETEKGLEDALAKARELSVCIERLSKNEVVNVEELSILFEKNRSLKQHLNLNATQLQDFQAENEILFKKNEEGNRKENDALDSYCLNDDLFPPKIDAKRENEVKEITTLKLANSKESHEDEIKEMTSQIERIRKLVNDMKYDDFDEEDGDDLKKDLKCQSEEKVNCESKSADIEETKRMLAEEREIYEHGTNTFDESSNEFEDCHGHRHGKEVGRKDGYQIEICCRDEIGESKEIAVQCIELQLKDEAIGNLKRSMKNEAEKIELNGMTFALKNSMESDEEPIRRMTSQIEKLRSRLSMKINGKKLKDESGYVEGNMKKGHDGEDMKEQNHIQMGEKTTNEKKKVYLHHEKTEQKIAEGTKDKKRISEDKVLEIVAELVVNQGIGRAVDKLESDVKKADLQNALKKELKDKDEEIIKLKMLMESRAKKIECHASSQKVNKEDGFGPQKVGKESQFKIGERATSKEKEVYLQDGSSERVRDGSQKRIVNDKVLKVFAKLVVNQGIGKAIEKLESDAKQANLKNAFIEELIEKDEEINNLKRFIENEAKNIECLAISQMVDKEEDNFRKRDLKEEMKVKMREKTTMQEREECFHEENSEIVTGDAKNQNRIGNEEVLEVVAELAVNEGIGRAVDKLEDDLKQFKERVNLENRFSSVTKALEEKDEELKKKEEDIDKLERIVESDAKRIESIMNRLNLAGATHGFINSRKSEEEEKKHLTSQIERMRKQINEMQKENNQKDLEKFEKVKKDLKWENDCLLAKIKSTANDTVFLEETIDREREEKLKLEIEIKNKEKMIEKWRSEISCFISNQSVANAIKMIEVEGQVQIEKRQKSEKGKLMEELEALREEILRKDKIAANLRNDLAVMKSEFNEFQRGSNEGEEARRSQIQGSEFDVGSKENLLHASKKRPTQQVKEGREVSDVVDSETKDGIKSEDCDRYAEMVNVTVKKTTEHQIKSFGTHHFDIEDKSIVDKPEFEDTTMRRESELGDLIFTLELDDSITKNDCKQVQYGAERLEETETAGEMYESFEEKLVETGNSLAEQSILDALQSLEENDGNLKKMVDLEGGQMFLANKLRQQGSELELQGETQNAEEEEGKGNVAKDINLKLREKCYEVVRLLLDGETEIEKMGKLQKDLYAMTGNVLIEYGNKILSQTMQGESSSAVVMLLDNENGRNSIGGRKIEKIGIIGREEGDHLGAERCNHMVDDFLSSKSDLRIEEGFLKLKEKTIKKDLELNDLRKLVARYTARISIARALMEIGVDTEDLMRQDSLMVNNYTISFDGEASGIEAALVITTEDHESCAIRNDAMQTVLECDPLLMHELETMRYLFFKNATATVIKDHGNAAFQNNIDEVAWKESCSSASCSRQFSAENSHDGMSSIDSTESDLSHGIGEIRCSSFLTGRHTFGYAHVLTQEEGEASISASIAGTQEHHLISERILKVTRDVPIQNKVGKEIDETKRRKK